MNYSIKIIIVYFGNTPAWLPYFIESCRWNPSISWLIYGDLEFDPEGETGSNLRFEKATLSEFEARIQEKLTISTQFYNPYKICDFKPVYGLLFSEYLEGYDYWGYSDLDILYGNFRDYLPENPEYDIITTGSGYLSGHFTLYRNNPDLLNLYRKIWKINKRLSDHSRLYYLDELSNFIGIRFSRTDGQAFRKSGSLSVRVINSLRYRLLKRLPLKYDITKVVEHMQKKHGLRLFRCHDHLSDEDLLKQQKVTWHLEWKKGRLIDLDSGADIFYFHFLKTKNTLETGEKGRTASFVITEKSIYDPLS